MLHASAIAFLVMTGEDELKGGKVHARMNVIHEAGLFQGRLGFTKAIVLLEEGCEEFLISRVSGKSVFRRETFKQRSKKFGAYWSAKISWTIRLNLSDQK